MPRLATSLLDSAMIVARLEGTNDGFAALDTGELTAATRAIADLRRTVDQLASLAAGEIARRSRRELGHQGLAQGAGFVSPVAMIQSLTQVGRAEATRQIGTGTLLVDVEASARLRETIAAGDLPVASESAGMTGAAAGATTDALAPHWQSLLAHAVLGNQLSIDKVDAIRRVMADISDGSHSHTGVTGIADAHASDSAICAAAICAAVAELIDAAPDMSPEQLARSARHARDRIDADGIQGRENAQRELRSVRTWWDATGMHCGAWRLPPEDGALLAEAFDQILSPRRGGPRFIDPTARHSAEDLLDDTRTNQQITCDAFADMIRLAIDADPGTLFGGRRPAVRVIVTADRLEQTTADRRTAGNQTAGHAHPAGYGHLEGRHDAIALPTIDRHLCNTGLLSIAFDTDGHCVNVGRDQRLFTERQRIGLAIRDAGCLFPGCDRPPSYCEAHHINPWHAKHGRTDIDDGILLCRRHHLLIHNNSWDVIRTGGDYTLIPPRSIDADRQPIPMPSRNPVQRDIRGVSRQADDRAATTSVDWKRQRA